MNKQDDQLRYAARQAAIRQRQFLRTIQGTKTSEGLVVPKAAPSPEHYHIIYNVPKDNISIPYWDEVFLNSREGYEKIGDMARRAEPNVEWYDNGSVGFETRLHGRADLWWIVCEVAACIRSECGKNLERLGLKRKLILIPGDGE